MQPREGFIFSFWSAQVVGGAGGNLEKVKGVASRAGLAWQKQCNEDTPPFATAGSLVSFAYRAPW
jgi:hypothetical protein